MLFKWNSDNMSTKIVEEDHISELDGLLASTSRQSLRERLQSCREHIEELIRARQASLNSPGQDAGELPEQDTPAPPQEGVNPPPALYEPIDTYDWNQTSKFLKLYLTVPGLTADDHDRVTYSFSDRGVDLRLNDVAGNNFKFVEENLSHRIKPKESRFKVQDDVMVLFMAKSDPKLRWGDVSTSRKNVAPDHYGRSELKVLLKEYYRIKESNVYQTPEYPLEASIREFMTSLGYYDIFDVASARTALASFAQSPPKAVVVNFSLMGKSNETKKLLTELVTAVAAAPDCKLMLTCPNFIRPDYSYLLDLIVKGSCHLTHFSGRISLTSAIHLPDTLYQLGVGIRNAKDSAAVARMKLPRNLQTLGVCVSRKVKAEQLQPLPKVKHPTQLFFYGTTDDDILWIVNCVDKLMGLRTCWLNFPNCKLTSSAIKSILGSFFTRSCPLQLEYQVNSMLASMGLSIVEQLQQPPTSIAAPMLGVHPYEPTRLVACGVLGLALETPQLSQVSKQDVQKFSRILSCQIKWAVEWTDAE